jgi:hypothetical protein
LRAAVQDLTEGFDRKPAGAGLEALRPCLQLRDGQAVDPLIAELGRDVLEVRGQRGDAPRLAVVLLEELVHQLRDGHVAPGGLLQLVERRLHRLGRLALCLEAALEGALAVDVDPIGPATSTARADE